MSYQFKNVTLHIYPNIQFSREEFYQIAPPNSLALDGIVSGGPFFDEYAKIGNLDHHQDVFRGATMNTMMQGHYHIEGGITDLFQEHGKFHVHLFVNDPDQDTSGCVYAFEHYDKFKNLNPHSRLGILLDATAKRDITAGAFRVQLSPKQKREHAWIFEPYTTIRKSGLLGDANALVMEECIKEICERIDLYTAGKAGQIELDTSHKILYESPYGYKMVHEIGGTDARDYLFSQGLTAYINLVSTRKDNKNIWVIGRKWYTVPFPVPALCTRFDILEKEMYTKKNLEAPAKIWNGSDLVSGCRNHGSFLDQEIIKSAADDFLKTRNRTRIFIP